MNKPLLDPDSPYANLTFTFEKGYWLVSMRDHPVAPKAGKLRLHRAICYDATKDENPLICRICKVADLDWFANRFDSSYVHVDHIDGNGSNNKGENLRPTHKRCNDNKPFIESLSKVQVVPEVKSFDETIRDGFTSWNSVRSGKLNQDLLERYPCLGDL